MVDCKTATSTFLNRNTRGTMMQTRSIKISFYLMSHSLWSAADVCRFSLSLPDSPIWVQGFIFHLSLLPWGVASFHSVIRLWDLRRLFLCTSLWDMPVMKGGTNTPDLTGGAQQRRAKFIPEWGLGPQGIAWCGVLWRFVAFIITKQTLLDWSVQTHHYVITPVGCFIYKVITAAWA